MGAVLGMVSAMMAAVAVATAELAFELSQYYYSHRCCAASAKLSSL